MNISQHYITADRVELNYDMPLSEIVFDFYDKLKDLIPRQQFDIPVQANGEC